MTALRGASGREQEHLLLHPFRGCSRLPPAHLNDIAGWCMSGGEERREHISVFPYHRECSEGVVSVLWRVQAIQLFQAAMQGHGGRRLKMECLESRFFYVLLRACTRAQHGP